MNPERRRFLKKAAMMAGAATAGLVVGKFGLGSGVQAASPPTGGDPTFSASGVQFPSFTVDPTALIGNMWYRSDLTAMKYSDGTNAHELAALDVANTWTGVQTFGVGYDTAAGMTPPKAVNVSGIGASSVALTLTDTVGATDFTVFYFPSTQTISSVTADIGGSSTNIPSSSFVSYAALSTCTAPCAYDSGSYVEVKAVYEVPTVLTFGFA